ncbi:MAG TPA: hypothetical protein PK317_03070, partial [Coprothermobacter proteolyticus]|nr:hypothetical protein [Coprothermobacter proteolyticus]
YIFAPVGFLERSFQSITWRIDMSDLTDDESDEQKNEEDRLKLDYTDKSSSDEDGEQPPSIPPWNDDDGEIEIL